ncbi:hypothetical protein GP486_007676 [Trichoglossum hirsutum]|uniref:Uncharacterized protein n=1 Tax=Trichoglossum hirsutum TaxID=265104 RepID=A0A9P8IBD9_9PEZI|nr:hypothetical protein GP486_007676 [Trichoglossum hirsutum]
MAITVAFRKRALSDSESSVSVSHIKRKRLVEPVPVSGECLDTDGDESSSCSESSSSDESDSSDDLTSSGADSEGEEDEPASPSSSSSSSSPPSSSSSSSSSSEDEVEITPFPRPRKPNMTLPAITSEGSSLLSRLTSLLPALEAANAELERDRAAGTLKEKQIENVDEDAEGGYIEMSPIMQLANVTPSSLQDLGLGVLQHRSNNNDDTSTCSDSSDDIISSDSCDDEIVTRNSQSQRQFVRKSSGEKSILGRLMGQKKRSIGRPKAKPMIVEVGGS